MTLRKVLFGGVFLVALFVGGFLLLLRGCLSQYDERSAMAPALLVEKDGKSILVSLVKYAKATSYSSKGGFTSKSVSTTYYLQTNNPQTGAPIGEQKIKHHSDIKHYPITTLGSSAGLAWIFIDELMAFDPFTLEKKADKNIIETKNPSLKDKLPNERKYYSFHPGQTITITANDGTFWQLNTNTLMATSQNEAQPADSTDLYIRVINQLLEKNRQKQDSLYLHDHPSRQLAAGKITRSQYSKHMEHFFEKRDVIYKERDSLQNSISILRKKESSLRQMISAIENIQRITKSYQQIKTNQDTINGQWRGMYSKTELDKLSDRVYFHTEYDEAARRQLYSSVYTLENDGDGKIDKLHIAALSPSQFFLQGGFLLDKNTARPIHLANGGCLVVHKDKIGNEGKILLSRITTGDQVAWTIETGLKEWIDWIVSSDHILIFGADNPSLSSDEVNVLLTVDLANGKMGRYDYFTNK